MSARRLGLALLVAALVISYLVIVAALLAEGKDLAVALMIGAVFVIWVASTP